MSSFEKKLINILNNIAMLLEIKGENPFKARAYSNAANIIKDQNIDISEAVRNNSLKEINGIGDALQKKITEYYSTGEIQYYKNLILEVPETLVEITKISNLGPKKASTLWKNYEVYDINSLEDAILSGKLDNAKGFTPKLREILINSIQHKKASKGRYLQEEAYQEAAEFLNILLTIPGILKAELSGNERRFKETVQELNFIAACSNFDINLKEYFPQIINLNKNYYKIDTLTGIPILLNLTLLDNYYWELHQSTGSEEYLAHFHKLIDDKGFTFDNEGLYKDNQIIKLNDEISIYDNLEIQYVPPEIREYPLALQRALKFKIPKLIERPDLKGMIHVHSNWSDGKSTIREMALKSKELGLDYIVICDHSQTASYANGLSVERVMQQHEEIDKLNNENLGIKIIKGIESDILPDGSLDYPENILEKFEIIVASVHSHFNLNKSEMTRRIIYALISSYTTMLGHPTGRLLLARQPYQVDIKEIIDAASDYGKIIEINCNPYRLDLSWEDAFYAKSKGVRVSINPDSHTHTTLSDIDYGIKTARKAWLEKEDVINCLDCNSFINEFVRK